MTDICWDCEHHSREYGCLAIENGPPCAEPEPETETCPICGRVIEANTDCDFCVTGEYEAWRYAAEYRDWERQFLAVS